MPVSRDALADLLLLPENDPRPLVSAPLGIGLFWSAKAACTNVLLWYLQVSGIGRFAAFYTQWPHKFRQEVLYASLRYQEGVRSLSEPAQLRWIRVIRDPYRRAISSYRHILRHGVGTNLPAGESSLDHLREAGLSFLDFLHLLQDSPVLLNEIHCRPQFHPLEADVTIWRLINVDVDNIQSSLEQIETELGLEIAPDERDAYSASLANIRQHHYALRLETEDHLDATPLTRLHADGLWPIDAAFLTERSRRLIETIYDVDFARYGLACV